MFHKFLWGIGLLVVVYLFFKYVFVAALSFFFNIVLPIAVLVFAWIGFQHWRKNRGTG
jgi:hypothetical protein